MAHSHSVVISNQSAAYQQSHLSCHWYWGAVFTVLAVKTRCRTHFFCIPWWPNARVQTTKSVPKCIRQVLDTCRTTAIHALFHNLLSFSSLQKLVLEFIWCQQFHQVIISQKCSYAELCIVLTHLLVSSHVSAILPEPHIRSTVLRSTVLEHVCICRQHL